jgi:hypothetical protein
MFKKKAPKRSSKGVGITSGLMDDVAGYAEGGEVMDDRTEREREARMLLERNRDENSDYQMFAEGERPQMYRPPATAPGMVPQPQPNPQQMQAMQMQRMAQMGMLPRFQEGGEVQSPSIWSRLSAPFRQRTGPILDPNTGEPAVFFNPDDPIDRTMGGIADMAALYATRGRMTFPRPRLGGGGLEPSTRPGPWEMDRSSGPWSKPQPIPRRAQDVGPGEPGSVPSMPRPRSSVPETGEVPRGPMREPGGETRLPPGFGNRAASAAGNVEFPEVEEPSYTDEGSPAGDYGGEGGGIMGGRAKGTAAKPKPEERKPEARPATPPKTSDLYDIKAERQAKAEADRKENMWLALMQAGLAIAGGRSSNAVTNIGQGGQAGLASFMALEQQRRRDEDAAMRRDIAQREINLQERRASMQEPLLAAQADYYRMRPAMAAAQLQARQQALLAKAQMDAVRDLDAQEAKNPMLFMGANGKPDPMKKEIALQRRTQQLATQYATIYGGGGFTQNPLGLNFGGSADEE